VKTGSSFPLNCATCKSGYLEDVDMSHSHSYVSPRKRAQRTLELLKVGCKSRMPWADSEGTEEVKTEAEVEVTDNIREWDYGEYEGMLTAAIRQRRKEQGLGEKWNIWSDGCPGGE